MFWEHLYNSDFPVKLFWNRSTIGETLIGNSPWNHKLTRKQTKEILLPRNTTGKQETKNKIKTNQPKPNQTKIKKKEKNVREKNCKQYLGGTFYLGRSLIPSTLFTFSELRKTNLEQLSLKIWIIVNVSCGSPSKHCLSLLLLWKEGSISLYSKSIAVPFPESV